MATRLSININDETAQALREMADEKGVTVTELVRRSVGLYKFVDDEVRAGSSLQLVNGSERTRIAVL